MNIYELRFPEKNGRKLKGENIYIYMYLYYIHYIK